MREKTYFAELCLLQVSMRDEIYCVDPLIANEQAEFWNQLLKGVGRSLGAPGHRSDLPDGRRDATGDF